MSAVIYPEGMNVSAQAVFDLMLAIARDPDISVGLIEDELMHGCINASLAKVLSEAALDIDVGLIDVRTCNYPLAQYDQDFNLRDLNYRSSVYVSAGGWLFDCDSFLCPPEQKGQGFAAFPNSSAAVDREIARRFNPEQSWHHDVAKPRGAPYTNAKTIALVANAIREPLAIHMGQQMLRETPSAIVSQVSGPRF